MSMKRRALENEFKWAKTAQIYIGRLHKHLVTSQDILDLTIESHIQTVLVSKKEGSNFAFITILEGDTHKALAMDGKMLRGQPIKVNMATKSKFPSLSMRQENSDVRICKFSKSDDGRCGCRCNDKMMCPFGMHTDMIGLPGGMATDSTPQEVHQMKQRRDTEIAEQRKNAANPEMKQAQDDKCHELLKNKAAGECIAYYCALVQSYYHL